MSDHTYPRANDPVYGTSIPLYRDGSLYSASNAQYGPADGKLVITAGKQYTATDATYEATTGVMKLTVPGHGMVVNDRIKIDDDALKFTCSMDSHASDHSYPRSTDPKSGELLSITNVTTDTFEVNVGSSPLVAYNPSAGTYNPLTGEMSLTIGTHTLTAGTNVKIANGGLTWRCNMDGYYSNHAYPCLLYTSPSPRD